MTKAMLRATVAILLLLPVLASAEGFNVSARASTLGLGAEAGYAFNDYVNVRIALNNYSRDYDTTEDDINYNFDFQLESTALLLDVHPFAGLFRVTAGILDNRNELNGEAAPAASYEIDGVNYTQAEVGTLLSNVQLGDSNPFYFGFGWSKALRNSGWGIGFDAGVVLMGTPELMLTSVGGTASNDPLFQSRLVAEEQAAQEDLDDFETYPVLALGLTYHF